MENNTDTIQKPAAATPPKTVDELIAELNVNKQDFTPPPPPPGAIPGEESNNQPGNEYQQPYNQFEEPPIVSPADLAKAKASAIFVTSAVDIGLSEILTMIAKGKDPEPYKATASEREDMINVWAEYLKDKGGDIPPGVMVLIMILVVYGPRAKSAFDAKAADEALAIKEAENDKLKKRIAELEKEKKAEK